MYVYMSEQDFARLCTAAEAVFFLLSSAGSAGTYSAPANVYGFQGNKRKPPPLT